MSRVDDGELENFVDIGRAIGQEFSSVPPRMVALVQAAGDELGLTSSTLAVLAAFDALLEQLAATEHRVDRLRAEVVAADQAAQGWFAEPGKQTNAWLDPETDSFVVNIASLSTGGGVSQPFVDRVRGSGPAQAAALLRSAGQLSVPGQGWTLLNDRERFADNWTRTFGSGKQALGALAATGVGLGSAALGLDPAIEQVFAHRPGAELQLSIVDGAMLLGRDPDRFVDSLVGLSDFQADPHSWLGSQSPDLLALILGAGGAGKLGKIGPTHLPGDAPDLNLQRGLEQGWAPADPMRSSRATPFETPTDWVPEINGGGPGLPGRGANCIDCTRAVESNWRGRDAVAAPLADPMSRGTSASLLEDWSGGTLRPTTLRNVERELEKMGPGASAMIVSEWRSLNGAHAYNAINDGGVIRWVDGQTGQTAPWPPPYANRAGRSQAIFIDPDGAPITRPWWSP